VELVAAMTAFFSREPPHLTHSGPTNFPIAAV